MYTILSRKNYLQNTTIVETNGYYYEQLKKKVFNLQLYWPLVLRYYDIPAYHYLTDFTFIHHILI